MEFQHELIIPNEGVPFKLFIFEGMNSEDVGQILDEDFGIAVRTGYHCAPFIHKYLRDESSLGTIRVGIGRYNTEEEICKLIAALGELADE